jgi:hypothetical protein
MPLPIITINGTYERNKTEGSLQQQYSHFQNLLEDGVLTDLVVPTGNMNVESPIELEVEPTYDGSVNLILTDKTSVPKLINSRFALKNSLEYKIPDRKGNINTNIYTEANFENETSLIKKVSKIVHLDYLGIDSGGKMPVGNYTFYFKLSDADDNMTDFISESGKVICHIGTPNSPKTIRGGLANEDSGKIVKFKLNNLDLAYTYIRVFYAKTTGVDDLETTTAHFIEDKFKILGEETEISITGYETVSGISIDDLNTQYALFSSVNTVSKAQNMTFVGGIKNNYAVFSTLEELSLKVVPSVVWEDSDAIGKIDRNYNDVSGGLNKFEYYNTKNIYYRLGYWNEEIYRFGIVYILNDYSLSPVFNVRGIDLLEKNYA